MLDALEAHGFVDNTITLLWSDHGWHLGEKKHWRKFTLWEESARTPLMFVVPKGLAKALPGGTLAAGTLPRVGVVVVAVRRWRRRNERRHVASPQRGQRGPLPRAPAIHGRLRQRGRRRPPPPRTGTAAGGRQLPEAGHP